ncbi:class I SAM-dependent methyltransferase [Nocardioides caldifontis]|uniref:class I SAM-dependent methyltransferase n=1 Tax=Nocardioides caldifontis TaxID=2588938 RepID=UPI0011E062C5|nr:class I SAM-dependent methyltransferase [Nocardioides caldifontis]
MGQVQEVAQANARQAEAWDGDEGAYWATHADAFDESLREYQPLFLAGTGVGPGDRVLDVGCGAGRTSLDLARTAASVTGVDLSTAQLEVARRRADAEGIRNVEFLRADAQVHPFDEVDVVVSRTGAMFFGDRQAAFANLARALRPGGRLALLVWQELARNEWLREIMGSLAAGRDLAPPPPGAPGPFALSDPDHVRALLTGAGFDEPHLEPLERRMYFGPTAAEAFEFMAGLNGWMVADLDPPARAAALETLAATMRAHETDDGVTFSSAMWLVTATRR